MSINESMLICHNQPYVEFSKIPRTVNLKGSMKVKDSISRDDEVLGEKTNWQEAYWQRDSCPGYKQLCDDYPTKFPYPRHPKDISLREFVVNFTMKWKYKPSNVFPNFIPTYRYIVHKDKPNYESYCECLLLMDKPGCTLDNVGTEFPSCEAELRDFVENSDLCPDRVKKEFKESQIILKDLNKENPIEGDAFDELYIDVNPIAENAPKDEWMDCYSFVNLDDMPQLNGDMEDDNYGNENNENEFHNWESDFSELNLTAADLKEASGWIDFQKNIAKLTENKQCTVDPDQLNYKQRKAYDFVCSWIDRKLSDPENTEPFYLNISGRAGCGKSFFLNCIALYANVIKKAEYGFLQKAAPTGTAAFLIGGSTLHALFRIPVQKCHLSKELPNLSGDLLRDLQVFFRSCQLLVIDEKSMIGLYTLYIIDKRLREVKPNSAMLPFGGVSVIIMGDFAQLPPVGDTPLFSCKGHLSHFQCIGKALFKHFDKTIIFDEIMRQQGDDQKNFRQILERLANGNLTKDDWFFLKTRELYGDGSISESETREFQENAVMLCALNKDLIDYNKTRIKSLGTPIAQIKSQNNSPIVAGFSSSKAMGLPSQVWLAKGCQVTLTTNLWKEAGLTNGANGIVKFIIYEKNVKPPSLPSLVIVEVPQYIGPFYKGIEKCIPIVAIKREWYKGKQLCWREMLPLKPAYAMSIHTAQGRTMDHRVIINLGPSEFANGLTYTAMSRCKKMEHLSFYKMRNYERFLQIKGAQIFKDRLKQDKRERNSDANFHSLS